MSTHPRSDANLPTGLRYGGSSLGLGRGLDEIRSALGAPSSLPVNTTPPVATEAEAASGAGIPPQPAPDARFSSPMDRIEALAEAARHARAAANHARIAASFLDLVDSNAPRHLRMVRTVNIVFAMSAELDALASMAAHPTPTVGATS